MQYTFKKEERLHSQKLISKVFSEGIKLPVKYGFFIITKNEIQSSPVQILFSIPKRRIKKAHLRNQLRRRYKEAYRLNKNNIYQKIESGTKSNLAIVFVFQYKEVINYRMVEEDIYLFIDELDEFIKLNFSN